MGQNSASIYSPTSFFVRLKLLDYSLLYEFINAETPTMYIVTYYNN